MLLIVLTYNTIIYSKEIHKVIDIYIYRGDFMRNIFSAYKPDYDEICRFKNEFQKFESNMTLVRENIFNWLDKKDKKEIEDIETMLIVEIEEINKVSLTFSIFPIVIFFLSIMGSIYIKTGIISIFFDGNGNFDCCFRYRNNKGYKVL